MKTTFLAVLLLFPIPFFAQEKGVTPISSPLPTGGGRGEVYAVVVGISDYQDEGIPDLRFADKDAEAFANFLRSPAGGSLDEDHLKVLLNEHATMGRFAMDLTWLMEAAKEGDKVIIYFSGHGDVENKSVFEPGFLLCWDAPPKVYFSGGSISLANLKLIISSISVGNKADVIVITDACRSGKLSGSSIDGPQATAVNLAQQFANETKILSCQPNEFSIEGEQWGGGRGAFSYHLVNALYGMADRNGDQIITLSEVDRYLEDHVTPEVEPLSQIPSVIGNKSRELATVDPTILDKIQQEIDQPKTFTAVDSKGLEDDILATLNPEERQMYASFKEALSKKMLLNIEEGEFGEQYADDFYNQLIEIPALGPLYPTMKRNYAAALLESGQQFMNGLLSSDSRYCDQFAALLKEDLKINIAYLEKTIELLGNDHYMYPTLQSHIHAYRGMGQEPVYDPEYGTESIEHFRKALAIQPELPQVWIEMAFTFGYNLQEYDSALYYAIKAIDAVPNWTYAYTTMAEICLNKSDSAQAKIWLDLAVSFDSTSALILASLGNWYREQGQNELAKQYFEKSINKGSGAICDMFWLSYILLNEGHFEDAEHIAKKAIKSFPTNATACDLLSAIYLKSGQLEKSEQTWLQLIEEDSTLAMPYIQLGLLYQMTGRSIEAIKNYEKAVSLDGNNPRIYAGLTHLNALFEDWESMLTNYRKRSLLEPRYKYLLAWADLYSNQFDEAGQILQQLPPDLSNDGAVLLTHASYLIQIRNYQEAEKVLLESIALDARRKNRLMALLGHVYLATGRKVEGEKTIKNAYSISEFSSDLLPKVYFYQTQGGLFRSVGRYDEAIELFKPMLEVNANDPEIHVELARSYSCKGDKQTALFHLEKALELGYKDTDQLYYNTSFKNLRGTEEWETLVKKYFPDEYKD